MALRRSVASGHVQNACGTRIKACLGCVLESFLGNTLLEQFAEDAIRQEKLGQRDSVDLLTLSFSSNDAVGHGYGPDSTRVHDICIRTDQELGKLFSYLD